MQTRMPLGTMEKESEHWIVIVLQPNTSFMLWVQLFVLPWEKICHPVCLILLWKWIQLILLVYKKPLRCIHRAPLCTVTISVLYRFHGKEIVHPYRSKMYTTWKNTCENNSTLRKAAKSFFRIQVWNVPLQVTRLSRSCPQLEWYCPCTSTTHNVFTDH